MMQITMDEVKELSRTELEARLSALLAEDHVEDDEVNTDYATLASIETVTTALARKLPPAVQRPENHWL
jgi:hypothetical protein